MVHEVLSSEQELERWKHFFQRLISELAKEAEEELQHSPITTEAQEQIEPIA